MLPFWILDSFEHAEQLVILKMSDFASDLCLSFYSYDSVYSVVWDLNFFLLLGENNWLLEMKGRFYLVFV